MKQIQLNPRLIKENMDHFRQQREKTNELLYLTLSTKVKHLDDSVTKLALKEDVTKEIRHKLATMKQHYDDSAG